MNSPVNNELGVDIKALPHSVQPLVKHLGIEKAVELLEENQGQIFYIPKTITKDAKICKVFGVKVVKEWFMLYRQAEFQIPMACKILKQLRDNKICSLIEEDNMPRHELVRQFKITRQQINTIYNHYLAKKSQQTLF
ncbi:MAG: hypothetical protein VX100_07280 [Pseudomonadota bacterium]|nr:hypothetical protein [Pseudomonadota bacterium]